MRLFVFVCMALFVMPLYARQDLPQEHSSSNAGPAMCALDERLVIEDSGKVLVRASPDLARGEFSLPESVEIVERLAFRDCRGLTVLKMPPSVHSVADDFGGCPSLSAFIVGDDNAFLSSRDGVLYDKAMTRLIRTPFVFSSEELTLPPGIRRIADGNFCRTKGLRKINFPKTVEEIGDFCFLGESDLRSFSVDKANRRFNSPDGMLVDVAIGVLVRCPPCCPLDEIVVPAEAVSIGESAFSYCRFLRSVRVSERTCNIGRGAFSRCHGLEKIEISASVKSIAHDAFYDCKSLAQILVASSNRTYRSVANSLYDDGNTLVRQTSAIDDGTVHVPDFVESVGSFAFSGLDNVEHIILAERVSNLSHLAFAGCPNIKKVSFNGDCPSGLLNAGLPDGCVVVADLKKRKWKLLLEACKESGCESQTIVIRSK